MCAVHVRCADVLPEEACAVALDVSMTLLFFFRPFLLPGPIGSPPPSCTELIGWMPQPWADRLAPSLMCRADRPDAATLGRLAHPLLMHRAAEQIGCAHLRRPSINPAYPPTGFQSEAQC